MGFFVKHATANYSHRLMIHFKKAKTNKTGGKIN